MSRQMRLSSFSASQYTLTYQSYRGESHLVIPAVLMVANAVIRPLHSKGPEFVPAEELVRSNPATMNGRAIVYDHPHGGLGSANSPELLDRESFGTVFNARIAPSTGNMVGDLYLSPSRAAKVGDHAVNVIEACRRNETVELSVGTWLNLSQESGTAPNGMTYEYVWRDMSYDHLAVGLSGGKGACSNEIGCGTNRAAASITNEGIEMKTMKASCKGGVRCATCTKLIDEVLAVTSDIPKVILEGLEADELRSLKASLEAAKTYNPWQLDIPFLVSASFKPEPAPTPPITAAAVSAWDPWGLNNTTSQG